MVIAKTASNFNGASYPVYQWTDGKLRNEGEVIYLFDGNGLLVDFVRYNNHAPWPESNTLQGRSLELVSSALDNHFATSWHPSAHAGGTPGEFTPVTGTIVLTADASVTVYPNPVSDELHINVTGNAGIYTIRICDLLGREMVHQKMATESGTRQSVMDVHALVEGHYFVLLTDDLGQTFLASGVVVNR
ncbi:MAG: T9SS type A sorting domain-containing protein [Flammeovirgaceae bacterium]|nr:T9SS type A sorting domain-containing protein [Flammeovirgaceae bacterium]